MTLLGESAAGAGLSRHWRGPLPNTQITRALQPESGFYEKVPMSLLQGAYPDLGVMVWALLRLSFKGQADVGSYRQFARCLHLGHLTDNAVDHRFGGTLKPLLGRWIIRRRLPDSNYLYEARLPPEAASDRYAILRPGDIDLLAAPPPEGIDSIQVSDLVDFCRWQLECGRRGWTVDPLRIIAERWNVTHPTMARSKHRLSTLGLLKVVPRAVGRHSDLIWLGELYDPHWQDSSTCGGEGGPSGETLAVSDAEQTGDVWNALDGRVRATGSMETQPPAGAALGRRRRTPRDLPHATLADERTTPGLACQR